jgi:hypothetical protein
VEYRSEPFTDGSLQLDRNSYYHCRFTRVRLIFSAIAIVQLLNCDFDDCSWEFNGPAVLTTQFMSGIYNGTDESRSKAHRVDIR